MYVIGKTGMGKTELLKNMLVQDIQEGRGVAFVDPHGDTADSLLDYIPEERIKDVIYFDPADIEYPIAFNVMEEVEPEQRHLVASGLMGVFKKIWQDMWSARMEYILNNAILALLEYPGSTLLSINRMMADKDYRKLVVDNTKDPVVKAFWTQEFARYTDRLAVEATASIQNKVGQFISSSLIRNIIGQIKTSINIREVMDSGKILIMNLARGKVGEDASRLLGALFITKIQLAAMSRIDIPKEEDRRDFYLYVDEFQHFATESFANILSEARKFRLNLVMAHQYITQMDETVRDAVFGNVGTIITFRVGAEDAEMLEKEFSPEFMMTDIVNLPKFNVYLKLMIDGVASSAFSAGTLFPFPPLEKSNREKILQSSRKTYGTFRKEVEEKIAKWSEPVIPATGDYRSRQPYPSGSRPFQRDNFPPKSSYRRETDGPRKFSGSSPSQPRPSFPKREDQGSPKPVSLNEALKQGPTSFKGKKVLETKKPVEPDVQGLRSILSGIIKRDETSKS